MKEADYDDGDMSPEQLRAARELLNWSREHLAKLAQVGATSLRMFEDYGAFVLTAPEMGRVRTVLRTKGVRFIPPGPDGGRGVRVLPQPHELFGSASIVFGGKLKRRPVA